MQNAQLRSEMDTVYANCAICGKCFQYRVIKEKYVKEDTALGPGTFADVLRTYQGPHIHREQRGRFGEQQSPALLMEATKHVTLPWSMM